MSLTKTRTFKTPETPPTRAELLRWAGWFFLANSLITLLIALRYLAVVDFPEGEYTRLFGVLAFVGHFVSLGFIGTVLMFVPVLLLPRRGPIFVLGIALAVSLVLGVTLDTFVFSQYRFHFNGMVFNLLLGGAAEEIFSFSASLWAMLMVFVAALLSIEWWLARRVWRFVLATPGRYYGYGVGFLLFAVFVTENMMFAWADASAYTPITKQIRFLPAYKPLTADRWFYQYGFADPDSAKKIARLDHSSSLDYPKAPLRCNTSDQPLNILYIVVDSWRFDTLTAQAAPNIFR
ncbi:MAG: DUF3413 domain-containing protein, partial [Gammaproteobacteria bacterium]|nr:DUF3413 domain-containing protein [Gammaproteobacteria bacterium]